MLTAVLVERSAMMVPDVHTSRQALQPMQRPRSRATALPAILMAFVGQALTQRPHSLPAHGDAVTIGSPLASSDNAGNKSRWVIIPVLNIVKSGFPISSYFLRGHFRCKTD